MGGLFVMVYFFNPFNMTAKIYAGLEIRNQVQFKKIIFATNENVMKQITTVVFNYFDIENDLAFTESRMANIVKARNIAMYLIRKKTKCPLTAIGAFFKRHHSTVISSLGSVDGYIGNNKNYRREIEAIKKFL